MQQQSNVAATVSMVSGITTVVLLCASFCLGLIPFVSMLNLLIYPLTWLCAFVALISGIVGYRMASTMDGLGRGGSLTGIAISLAYMLLQLGIFLLVMLVGGMVFVMAMLGQA